MGGVVGAVFGTGGRPTAQQDNRLTGLQVQKTGNGVTIPVVLGTSKVSPVLIWSGNFIATPHQSGGGGGKGGGGNAGATTTYTYTSGVILALCHGQIQSIGVIWRDKSRYAALYYPPVVRQVRNASYAVPGGVNVGINVGMPVVADYGVRYYQGRGQPFFSKVAGIPTVRETYSLAGTTFTVRSSVARTVLLNYDYLQSGYTVPPTGQLGLQLFAGAPGQAGWGWLQTAFPSQYSNYSGVAYLAGANYALSGGAMLGNHTVEVSGLGWLADGKGIQPKEFLTLFVANRDYGAGFAKFDANWLYFWGIYCFASGTFLSATYDTQRPAHEYLTQLARITNSELVWGADSAGVWGVRFVPRCDIAITGNGVKYTPNLTIAYALTDDDYLAMPKLLARKRASDAYNHVTVEYMERGLDYSVSVVDVRNQAGIDRFGMKSAPTIVVHEVHDRYIAERIAHDEMAKHTQQLNHFAVTVSAKYARLELMDIVAITDVRLGLSAAPMRVIEISDGVDSQLDIVLEQMAGGLNYTPASGAEAAGNSINSAVRPAPLKWR